jgi:serine/threonine-protein kinase HipA
VKTDGGEYPGLAENEYHCMTIARAAGLEVPDFWMSDDRKLFVIRRFDIDESGRYLGFEEIASLTGRSADRKYEGSYAQVAEATMRNCAAALRTESLERLFRQLALCCLLRNGDAHLKNWGILYSDPVGADHDARLSPTYDMVCTTMYLPRDVLALSFVGSKSWPDRSTLERFGREKCGVTDSPDVIDALREVVSAYRPAEATPTWEAMKRELSAAVAQLGRGA